MSAPYEASDAELVQQAYEQLPIGLGVLHGPELRFVAANAAYRTFAGDRELLGAPMREVFAEMAGQQGWEIAERVFARGQAETGNEWRFQVDQGEGVHDVYIDFTVSPTRCSDGAVTGVNLVVSDLTEQVQRRKAAQQEAVEAERRYQAARDVVAELQQALLPPGLPVLPAATVAARYLVAAQDQAAGGDWFDAVCLPDGRLALIVGDIVGHGVAASAAMGQLRAVLNELLLESGDLGQALARVDRAAARSPATRAATLCVAILDPGTGVLHYSTCGHPPPLIVRPDGNARYLAPSGGGPLGTGSAVTLAKERLRAGEVLLLYSDGLIERPGQPQSTGLATLAEVAGDAVANRAMPVGAPISTAERVCEQSVELLSRGGYDDDVTVLAAELRPTPVRPLHRKVPARPASFAELRDATIDWLQQVHASPADVRSVELAVTELVANAIEHAYPPEPAGTVELEAEFGADGVMQLAVADHGNWQPPTAPQHTSGRGLWMTGAVVDELQLTHEQTSGGRPGGTTATIRHRLHHPATSGPDRGAATESRPGMDFSATLDEGPPRVLRVSGSLDITTVADFAERLDTASRGGVHPIVVDLSDVDVLASAGVSVLFTARDHHAVHEQPLTLVAAPNSVPAQILDLVGLSYTTEHALDGPGR